MSSYLVKRSSHLLKYVQLGVTGSHWPLFRPLFTGTLFRRMLRRFSNTQHQPPKSMPFHSSPQSLPPHIPVNSRSEAILFRCMAPLVFIFMMKLLTE